MAKKASGLGRGLGDLLEDNSYQIRHGQGSAVRKEVGASEAAPPAPPTPAAPAPNPFYTSVPQRSLYDSKPKNRSLKANFKNFNR